MLDFYLSINNSEEVIHIPVTPSEFTVSSSQGTETFETANYGWIKIIGNPELKTVSVFKGQKYERAGIRRQD